MNAQERLLQRLRKMEEYYASHRSYGRRDALLRDLSEALWQYAVDRQIDGVPEVEEHDGACRS